MPVVSAFLLNAPPETTGQPKNRLITGQDATTVEEVSWPDDLGPTEIDVHVVGGTVNTDYVRVCFDAADTSMASIWLTESELKTSDSQHYIVRSGQSRTFKFSSPLKRLHTIGSTAGPFKIFIEGV